jgi:hypothetical protein
MCPLLAQIIIGFFSFFFAVAVYSTNEVNKAGLKQSLFLVVYGRRLNIKKSADASAFPAKNSFEFY